MPNGNHTTEGPISGIRYRRRLDLVRHLWSTQQLLPVTNGYAVFRADLSALTPVPLPASVLLLGSGLMGLGLMGYRSKKS